MNNRIMAMLFALVAAMFISIVPVKAEAATPCTTHVDTYQGGNGKCDVCGEHVHHAITHNKVNATCAEEGNEKYYTCNFCDAVSKKQNFTDIVTMDKVKIPKLTTHTVETFTNQGAQQHWGECTVCGTIVKENHSTQNDCECDAPGCNKLIHDLEHYSAKAPTCVAEGNVEYYYCKRCETGFSDAAATQEITNVTIPATGHDQTKWDNNDTHHWYICTVEDCGAVLASSQAAHTYDVIDNEDGTHGFVCSVCGYVPEYTEEHKYTNAGDNVVRNETSHIYTCTEGECGNVLTEEHYDGVTGPKDCLCDRCGYEMEHSYDSYVKTSTGHTSICSVCEKRLEKEEHKLEWVIDDETHMQYCTVCERVEVAEAGHEFEYTANGTTHIVTCKHCAYEAEVPHIDEYQGGNCKCDKCGADTHHLEYVEAVAPACRAEGNVAYYECQRSGCGLRFTDAEGTERINASECVIPETGHKHTIMIATDEEHYYICANEGCRDIKESSREAHEFVYEADDGKTHTVTCAHEDCDYIAENVAHDDGGTINCVCKDCKGDIDHVPSAWKLYPSDKTKHFEQCTVCYKTLKTEAHDFEYTQINETYHEPVCKVCDHKTSWEKHEDADNDCICDGCGCLMVHVRDDLKYTARHNPTCTEDGNVGYYTCNTCGRNFEKVNGAFVVYEKDVTLKAHGHNYLDKGLTYVEVLGKDIEMHAMQCEYCGRIRTFYHNDSTGDCLCDINGCGKLAHSHTPIEVKEKAATCQSTGHQAYWKYACGKMFSDAACTQPLEAVVVYPVTEHDWSDWTADGKNHVRECLYCGETESGEHVDQWGDRRCDVCEVELELEAVEGKAPTCEEDGWKPYWKSSYTGYLYADKNGNVRISAPKAIKKLGHQETGWEDEGGEYHKMTCQREDCDWVRREKHSGDSDCYCEVCGGEYVNHTLNPVAMVPATCQKAGTEAHYKCSCGQLYDLDWNPISAPKAIAQLKHDMNPTVKKDAKENKHYIQCKNCDYKLYENHGMVLSDPNKGNYHQWLCDCGELEIETHYDKNGDNKCDVCDHSMNGSSSDKVEQHDNKTVYTGEKNTVTATKDWWWNWQEWFTPSNSGGSGATGNTEENTTSSTGTAVNGSSNSGTANNGTTNNGGNVEEDVVTPPAGNEGVDERSVSTSGQTTTVTESQASVITQFITWFLSLFGF